MNFWILFLSFLLSFIFLLSYIEVAKKFKIVDKPDERRNHKGELVRGGGIILIFMTIASSLLLMRYNNIANSAQMLQILTIFGILGLLFFIEDVRSLRRSLRFALQFIAAILASLICQERVIVFTNLPYLLNIIIVVIGWIWFMNLYNFMDGIDGITATNTIFFATSVLFLISVLNLNSCFDIELFCLAVIPIFLAFLILNWSPSKLILGDSGSIAFGFLFGYIFLSFASYIGLLVPILLCSYYLCDSSITLIKRIAAKENILHPHSKHFFQIALRGGLTAKQICLTIFLLNICLFSISYMLITKHTPYTVTLGIFLGIILNVTLLKYFYSFKKYLTK